MYCSLIHLYIHPFIHLSIYSFSFFFFHLRGGGEVWGHSKSCLYRRRIRRPGREGRGIYLFLTSSSLFLPPSLFSFLYCICISIDSFSFFYVLTFRLFLLWNGLLFCLINYLCISTYFKSTEISKIWFLAIWAWYKNYFRDNYLPKTQLNVIH